MSTFKIGEQALVLPGTRFLQGTDQYIGTTVTIQSSLREDLHFHSGQCYRVKASDGVEFYITPELLQKLPPPKEKTCSWDDCVWQPKDLKVPAHASA